MKIVTSGYPYIDIDAYACAIAYAELLNLKGEPAMAVCTPEPNESITKTVRSWGAQMATTYEPSDDDTFVLVDISNLEYFERFVALDRVSEIIDHHAGYESYWQERIGDGAQIEFIGAACTLVYERWKKAGLLDKMSVTSARILVCGILDNTLNFGAKVCTPRDVEAYDDLLSRAELPAGWTATYFSECQASILDNPTLAIENDTKVVDFKTYSEGIAFGQVVVWDGKQVIDQHIDTLRTALSSIEPAWLLNVVSVEEGISYFVTDNDNVKTWVANLLGLEFAGLIGQADRLWLRKEVIKEDIDRQMSSLA